MSDFTLSLCVPGHAQPEPGAQDPVHPPHTVAIPGQPPVSELQGDAYVTLRHGQAPWRGQWVIRTDLGGRFWALHDRHGRVGVSDLIERYSFNRPLDASRFLRHLLHKGWTVADAST